MSEANAVVQSMVHDLDSLGVPPSKTRDKFAHRCRRWYQEGTKDGLCGVMRPLKEVPTEFRMHYNSGHTYGMFQREAG